jgi:hypothetical protein
LQRAIAPAGLLSSAAPEPAITAELELARALALAEARGTVAAPAAGTGSLRLATAFAALTSLFTTFFWWVIAFLLTPPWPEQAPRPDETDVVPSLQIVAAACACSDEPDIAATAAMAVARNQFRDESTVPPRCLVDDQAMRSNAYARREMVTR